MTKDAVATLIDALESHRGSLDGGRNLSTHEWLNHLHKQLMDALIALEGLKGALEGSTAVDTKKVQEVMEKHLPTLEEMHTTTQGEPKQLLTFSAPTAMAELVDTLRKPLGLSRSRMVRELLFQGVQSISEKYRG